MQPELVFVAAKVDGVLESLRLELSGECAVSPSTSNSREIGYRFAGGRRVPFIRKTVMMRQKLAHILDSYKAAVMLSGREAPTFGAERVTALVLLATGKRRYDSHNYSKPIGDWLQDAGIIDNDTNAEILCFKAADIPGADASKTQILLVNRDLVEGIRNAFIEAVFALSRSSR